MNPLNRLIVKQQEELETINEKIELWKKYKDDYGSLKKLIDTIGDRVKEPYRIPIAGTQIAFADGHIIHTNEITVLLGDNYFALRSAKQANQIINRRLSSIDDNLKKSHEAKRKTEEWIKAANEHKKDKEEFVEIIETV